MGLSEHEQELKNAWAIVRELRAARRAGGPTGDLELELVAIRMHTENRRLRAYVSKVLDECQAWKAQA